MIAALQESHQGEIESGHGGDDTCSYCSTLHLARYMVKNSREMDSSGGSGMTANQLKRLHQMRDYVRKQRDSLPWGNPVRIIGEPDPLTAEQRSICDAHTNVLAYVILMEDDE